MTTEDMLTALLSQARAEGAELVTLRAIAEEAGELGAARAPARIGLSDEAASGDIDELRELLQAWRDAKASAWKAAIEWLVRGVCALLLVGIAVRLGVAELVR